MTRRQPPRTIKSQYRYSYYVDVRRSRPRFGVWDHKCNRCVHLFRGPDASEHASALAGDLNRRSRRRGLFRFLPGGYPLRGGDR
jgi:hypothetical protein